MNTNVSCFKWERKCQYRFQNIETTSVKIYGSLDTEYFKRPSQSEFFIRSMKGSLASRKVGPGLPSTVRISSRPITLVRMANAFIWAVLAGTSRMLNFRMLLKTRSASSRACLPSLVVGNPPIDVDLTVLDPTELLLVLIIFAPMICTPSIYSTSETCLILHSLEQTGCLVSLQYKSALFRHTMHQPNLPAEMPISLEMSTTGNFLAPASTVMSGTTLMGICQRTESSSKSAMVSSSF